MEISSLISAKSRMPASLWQAPEDRKYLSVEEQRPLDGLDRGNRYPFKTYRTQADRFHVFHGFGELRAVAAASSVACGFWSASISALPVTRNIDDILSIGK